MKRIEIKEAHTILLGIAKAFAKVCEENDIPYYMLGGTMLGAIRHKGFIPWDDDMDFGVPRKYYPTLIKKLETQLPECYRCCTYINGLTPSVIMKIDDNRTVIVDKNTKDNNIGSVGLNIDIFPLDFCSPNDAVLKKEKILTYIYRAKYAQKTEWSKMRRLFNTICDKIFPWSIIEINKKKEMLLHNQKPGPYLSNVFGAWGIRECVPVEWYGDGIKFKFEDTEFCGIKEYDRYLSQLYGNYMSPPQGDMHVHLEGIYWR